MKKFLVAAMMVLGATSAFAGDSDALKAVMKAKSYAEAEALVKQNLGQMYLSLSQRTILLTQIVAGRIAV